MRAYVRDGRRLEARSRSMTDVCPRGPGDGAANVYRVSRSNEHRTAAAASDNIDWVSKLYTIAIVYQIRVTCNYCTIFVYVLCERVQRYNDNVFAVRTRVHIILSQQPRRDVRGGPKHMYYYNPIGNGRDGKSLKAADEKTFSIRYVIQTHQGARSQTRDPDPTLTR